MRRAARAAALIAILAAGPMAVAGCATEESQHEEQQVESAKEKAEETVRKSEIEKKKVENEGANLENHGGG